jgi:hypothetical protein
MVKFATENNEVDYHLRVEIHGTFTTFTSFDVGVDDVPTVFERRCLKSL